MNVHVTESVRTDEDHLVAIAVYPQQVRSQEEANVATMTDGVVETID